MKAVEPAKLTKLILTKVDPETKELLRIKAFENRMTQAQIVRNALAEYLQII